MSAVPPTILHVFSTFRVGGPQRRFVTLANQFGAAYRHVILAMDGATDAAAELAPTLDVTLLPVPPGPEGLAPRIDRCRRLLRTLRPDLLMTSNWGSIEWAMANLLVGCPHIHLEDGFGPAEAHRQHRRRVWTRRLVLWPARIVLPSRTLETIAREVWRLPRRHLTYIANGIECARFDGPADPALVERWLKPESESERERGIPEPVIGTVAALRPEKNLKRLLEAFAQMLVHRPARLVIVGDGPERAALEAHAQTLGVASRTIFTGACPHPEKLLPAFTVFALSSDTEQMPLSLLEAMAAARPVVATQVGDVPEMVAEINRPFVVAPEAGALAQALLTVLGDEPRAAALGAANRAAARLNYDVSRMVQAYRALLDTTLAPQHAARCR